MQCALVLKNILYKNRISNNVDGNGIHKKNSCWQEVCLSRFHYFRSTKIGGDAF